MINSLLSKEVKSITIDKMIINRNNEDILLTNPMDIKNEVNNYFQNIAGSLITKSPY